MQSADQDVIDALGDLLEAFGSDFTCSADATSRRGLILDENLAESIAPRGASKQPNMTNITFYWTAWTTVAKVGIILTDEDGAKYAIEKLRRIPRTPFLDLTCRIL
jgi:hypothetical protein